MAEKNQTPYKIEMVHNKDLEMDPAVRRFLEAHKQQIDNYGQHSDSVVADSKRVIKSIIQDVKDIRRKSITALKKDADFVYYEVKNTVKGQGSTNSSRGPSS
jgi:predicted SnoaL-like aldol condensation-catalyzing enzyme